MSAPLWGSRTLYSKSFPSRDQSIGNFTSGVESSGSSLPGGPPASFQERVIEPDLLDPNAIRLPSGDHSGKMSSPASNVIRSHARRAVSYDQMSMLPFAKRKLATRRPSGESAGPVDALSGYTTFSTSRPDRSPHTSCRWPLSGEGVRYTIGPAADADSAVPSFALSANGKG